MTAKLFVQGYGMKGFANYFVCQLNWFIIMNDFGFPPFQLLFSNGIFLHEHAEQDIYNPTDPYFGNSLLKASNPTACGNFNKEGELIDWLYMKQAKSDLRMSALLCRTRADSTIYFTNFFEYSECRIQQISPYSNRPVCYTTEAVKYAQSGYFYANFIGQLFNNIICKTRRESVFTQGMHNLNMYFGMTTEIMIGFILAYIYPINIVFGSRDNIFMHFGIVAVPVSLLILLLEEVRRYLLRRLPPDSKGRPNWFERCTLW